MEYKLERLNTTLIGSIYNRLMYCLGINPTYKSTSDQQGRHVTFNLQSDLRDILFFIILGPVYMEVGNPR